MDSFETVKILLVDDREDNLLAAEAVLSSPHLELRKAQSGQEAIELAAKEDFAAILMDVQMPGMDGFEAVRRIRGQETKGAHVPVIYVTAIDRGLHQQREGYQSGAVDFLYKPFDSYILESKVNVFAELYRAKKKIERQAREQELRAREDLSFTLETMTEGFSAYDKNYILTHANKPAEALLGCPLAEIIGKSAEELFPSKDRLKFQARYDRVMATGEPDRFLESYEGRWLQVHAYRTRNGGFAAFFRDETERKITEELARESQARLKLITDALPILISYIDRAYRYQTVNRAYEAWFGKEEREVVGKTVSDIIGPEAFATVKPHLDRALAGELAEVEQWVRYKHGGSRFIHVFYIPDKDEAGIVKGVVTTVSDRTSERTALDKVNETLKLRDDFLKICSHELKTPITSMKMQYQMAARRLKNGDASVLEHAAVAKRLALGNRQLDRMSSLIDDMLDFAEISKGNLPLRREVIDLSGVIQGVVEAASEQLAAAGTEVTLRLEEACFVDGDSYRLEQVVSNLLTNAGLKYAAGKPLTITLQKFNDRAVLSVADQGIGIHPDDQGKIFQKFQKAHSINSFGGVGLGLYISREIVEAHGGKVAVASKAGEGATFTVELPLAPRKPGDSAQNVASAANIV